MYTLEVRLTGFAYPTNKTEKEVIWLDRDRFRAVQTSKRAGSRELVTDGKVAFDILRGKARLRYLTENGYIEDAAQNATKDGAK